MYLLIATLVSGQAHAGDLILSTQPCKSPCLGIGIGSGGTILPPDWLEQQYADLSGNLYWFRVAVTIESGAVKGITLGDYALTEDYFSRAESDERTSVYYVPVSRDTTLSVYGEETSLVDLVVAGYTRPNL
jgi:hypothetical protein